MNFGKQFEYHKIPEWYDEYLDYDNLTKLIEEFNVGVESSELIKLTGFYTINSHHKLIPLEYYGKGDKD
jgi:hypothetical protein